MRRMRAFYPVTLGILALWLATVTPAGFQNPPADHGAAGAWQKLLKLRTTASVLHTTAHPDDEHGGVLTMLSRGEGAQVSLLTLTRGESGDNALGPELFDALGSSDARSVRYPQFSDYRANPVTADLGDHPSVVDPASQKVYYTGLTDVQQHGIYGFGLQATYQAGEFVKFNLGGNYTLVQGHFITFDQACNPDFNNNIDQSGPCRTGDPTSGFAATGIPNPNFRKALNDPGRRFKVDDSTGFDAWISATVMF